MRSLAPVPLQLARVRSNPGAVRPGDPRRRLQSEARRRGRSANEVGARLRSELEEQTRSANEAGARLQSELDGAGRKTHTQRRARSLICRADRRCPQRKLETIRAEANATRTESEQGRLRISELTRSLERAEERESVATGEIESLRERLAERAAHEADSERLQVVEGALAVVRSAEDRTTERDRQRSTLTTLRSTRCPRARRRSSSCSRVSAQALRGSTSA